MRLTDEQLEFIKKWMAKCEEKDEIPTNGMTIGRLLEHIEALRLENVEWQENYDELDTGHSKLYKAYCEAKQENEQLQAQNGAMRQQLEIIKANIHEFPPEGMTIGKEIWIKTTDEALSDTPAAYHNPGDVEVLEKAKDILLALGSRMSSGQWPAAGTCERCGCEISYKFHRFCRVCTHDAIVEVITAIDKVIGGKEDANV